MHALIVLAHPDPGSLTHSVASQIAAGIAEAGPDHSVEIADLAAEGFDPRFTTADLAVHRREAPAPTAVSDEQARIDRADELVIVYPVYWWSMPGLLKGWIDRVFANGWAYDESPETGLVKRLGRLRIHLVAIGGADMRTYARHGYFGAMKTQIDHGIFDYCGARVSTSELLIDSHAPDQSGNLDAARRLGRELFAEPSPRAADNAA